MSNKVYEIVNQRIIELLKQGTVPWRKPWRALANIPKNLVSRREYRGINLFILSAMPYGSPFWVTFKQVSERGGRVRRGERATPIIFWKWIDGKDKDATEEETAPDGPKGKVPLLRYYSVFNIEQVEGINPPQNEEPNNTHLELVVPGEVVKQMPLRPKIDFGGNRAFYSPILDTVQLPHLSTFESPEDYYCTYFHELIHSTGHASRLGRKSIMEPSYFGSHEYSREELVAEMGAAFLCWHCGIGHSIIENSAAYINGWLNVLGEDKKFLVVAAAQAQKAADFILGHEGDDAVATSPSTRIHSDK